MPYVAKLPTAQEIAEAAARKGISPRSVCRRADLDAAVMLEWLQGKRNPSITNVQKLIDVIEAAPIPPK